jgi:hypothetical protein
MTVMNDRDAERLELLDRIAKRIPELDLNRREIEWSTLPDGAEAPRPPWSPTWACGRSCWA